MKKLKIVHIINNLKMGGAEVFLVSLLNLLAQEKDLEIHLICLNGDGDLEKKLSSKIIFKKFSYNLFLKYLSRLDPMFRWRLFKHVKDINPDIIHGHLIKADVFSKILGGLLKKPVIITQHDILIENPGKKQSWTNKYLTKAVAVSPVVAEYLENIFHISKDKIEVIHDGIDISQFSHEEKKYNPRNPKFIYTGRIIKIKGLEYAISGLSQLQKDIPGVEFHIFGDGDDRQRLTELIDKKGYHFVFFHGRTNNIPKALAENDIYILPSKSEGFSMSTLEAAAAGKPIIATKTGAITEMIKNGESGFFVEYGDASQIYRAAKRILNSDVEKMGDYSYKIVKNKFSIEKVAEMYYNLYLKVKNENEKKQIQQFN